MASRSKKKRKKKTKKSPRHQKTLSLATGLNEYKSFKVPRKLGPRDVGRIKYRAIDYEEDDNYDFLREKVHKHSRTSSFNARKARKPVPRKAGVADAGSPASWKTPSYFKAEVKRMSRTSYRHSFLDDVRPMVVRSKNPDSDLPLPKGTFAGQESAPFSWNPIEYEIHNDPTSFLTEKYWFEASKVAAEGGFSHLLEQLPPEKLLKIQDIPPPTGYRSKQRFLERLKDIVFEDSNRLMVPRLSALNEHSDSDMGSVGSPLMSGLSDFADDIEHDLDREMTDALDSILMESTPELQSAMAINMNLPTSLDTNSSMDSVQSMQSMQSMQSLDTMSTGSVLSALSRLNSVDSEDIETQITQLSPLDSVEDEKEQKYEQNSEQNSGHLEEELPSPFHRRTSSRRELLQKSQLNIDEIHCALTEDEKELEVIDQSESTDIIEEIEMKTYDDDKTLKPTSKIKKKKSSNSVANSQFTAKIPSEFICPISGDIMNEAVMAADKRMYDRSNIKKHLETHDTSPVSGTKLRHKNLMPFNELTDKITRWKMKHRVKKRRRKRKGRKVRTSGSGSSGSKSSGNGITVRTKSSAECGVDSSDTC